MRRLGVMLVILLAAAGALTARGRLDALASERRADPLLYLPNGRQLQMMSLGHASVLADWLYVWAIQFYSDYEREDRYRYVEHIFGKVIAELDPEYVDPYWLGALIMIVEAHDLDGGLALLDQGFGNNPEAWVLPYMAGWECYHAERFERAGEYFSLAAAVPGAPAHIRRMRAGTVAKAGDLRRAIELWQEVLRDPGADAATRAIAERQLRQLEIRVETDALGRAVAIFREREGRNPARLDDLVRAGVVRELPLDPDGRAYGYDPATGRVSTDAGRLLGRDG